MKLKLRDDIMKNQEIIQMRRIGDNVPKLIKDLIFEKNKSRSPLGS